MHLRGDIDDKSDIQSIDAAGDWSMPYTSQLLCSGHVCACAYVS